MAIAVSAPVNFLKARHTARWARFAHWEVLPNHLGRQILLHVRNHLLADYLAHEIT